MAFSVRLLAATAVFAGALVLDGSVTVARSQSAYGIGPAAVTTFVDGKIVNWPELATFPADSLDAVVRNALQRLRDDGHLLAQVDSIAGAPTNRAYLSAGPLVRVADVLISGDSAIEPGEAASLMQTKEGSPLRRSVLEDDIQFLLLEHSRRGWPLAEARVDRIRMHPQDTDRLRIDIRIDRGPPVTLGAIELPGADRTRPAYIQRIVGLRVGSRIARFDPNEIRRRVLATNLFRDVGVPVLEMRGSGFAAVVIPVREEAPGNFDLVLGYVPRTSSSGSGGLVGNGHLELRNLFGGGRLFQLKLNRLPGRVSSVDAGVADPNIAGLPIGIEGWFNGLQQDSTYDKQSYAARFSYQLTEGMRLVGGATREITKPGQAGLRLRNGRQRIPRASASFVGIGVRYESVDWPINPRTGLQVESMFERGSKNRTSRRVEAGDTLTSRTRVNQERLTLRTRYYLPTLRRQLVAIGVDAQLILSDEYDESDLIRFGGSNSLRGYNEEQFVGRLASRLVVEYRFQLDRYAYAYGFTDIGLLETVSDGTEESRREILPGFGLGMQFRTQLGVINVSYAFNDEDGPIDGRVHVGLSFSL